MTRLSGDEDRDYRDKICEIRNCGCNNELWWRRRRGLNLVVLCFRERERERRRKKVKKREREREKQTQKDLI